MQVPFSSTMAYPADDNQKQSFQTTDPSVQNRRHGAKASKFSELGRGKVFHLSRCSAIRNGCSTMPNKLT